MNIYSNFPLGERSIKEFARVLLPELQDKDVYGEFSQTAEEITLKLRIDGVEKKFIYQNLESKIDDVKIIIFKTALLKFCEKTLPWGGLIGVRPTKVVKRLRSVGYQYSEISDILQKVYLVTLEKAELLIKIYQKELELMNSEATSIYIGIPFCPTKCRYCSFASYEIGGPVGERYYAGFVDTLLREIELTGKLVKDKNMRIESIYIGGGTPSTLREKDLERVLQAVNTHIDRTHLREYTFEAGREDSITEEKLEIAKKYGIDRMSLNPQTFNEGTLEKINRKMDLENFDRCYHKMKELGFIINMDIILGLPGESDREIVETLNMIEQYDIENLTVHSLALKKASVLFKDENTEVNSISRETVEERVNQLLERRGMHPYYIYRQKNSADWGEYVGFAKTGYESLFNMEMIEENQNTIGIGGGAISKRISRDHESRDEIERLVNPKDPATYIREMEERFHEKVKLFS
ncbi:MAG: coproporphyrinogen III oxidase [Fusobacteriaceae bacterium]